jgi:peptide-methionine (S)-S-oxide reductase
VTTEILPLRDFYHAEDNHQQYLSDARNPYGYCGLGGTGVSCPVGVVPPGTSTADPTDTTDTPSR